MHLKFMKLSHSIRPETLKLPIPTFQDINYDWLKVFELFTSWIKKPLKSLSLSIYSGDSVSGNIKCLIIAR